MPDDAEVICTIGFYKRFGFEKTDNKVEEEPDRPDYMITIPQIEMVKRA
jgi:hypothetical protein